MRDNLKDIVQHTHGLGFIESAKIINEEGTTSLEAMDDDRTVIVQAKFKQAVPGLSGTFGLPNLSKLNILLNIDEFMAVGSIRNAPNLVWNTCSPMLLSWRPLCQLGRSRPPTR